MGTSSLAAKLKIKPGHRVLVLNAPAKSQIKPTTGARVDLMLCLRDVPARGRLLSTGGLGKGDRMTHRIAIDAPEDVDDEVKRWYAEAYKRGV